MATNPWDEFPELGQQAAPAAPGVIYGRPKQPTPYETEDQAMQREAAARADRAESRADRAENRAAEKDTQGTVEQGKARSFLLRALNANDNYSGIGNVGARSLPGQAFKDWAPNAANYISDDKRQLADQAEREFIAAILRYDSGAAIPPEEFVTNGQIYFPRPGDSEAVLKQKAKARVVALKGLAESSGPNGREYLGQISEMEKQLGEGGDARSPEMVGDIPKGSQVEFGMDRWGQDESAFNREAYLQERYGLTSNQEAQIVAFWNANRGNAELSPQAAQQWYASNGLLPPSEEELADQVAKAQQGYRFAGIDTSGDEEAYNARLDAELKGRGAEPESTAGTVGVSAAQGVMMGSLDEVAGVSGALKSAFEGENPVSGYRYERDTVRRELERAREESPLTSLISEGIGGVATGGVGFRGVQTVRDAAKAGAATGAVAGFNYGEGPAGSVTGAAVGGVLGAGLAAGTQAIAPRVAEAVSPIAARILPNRGVTPEVAATGREVIEAGERRQVPIRQPDVRPETRAPFANAERSENGAPIIREAQADDMAAGSLAMARDVGGGGNILSRDQVGETARNALDRYGKRSRDQARKLYEQADASVEGQRFPSPTGSQQIDQEIAALREGGEFENRSMIQYLEGLKQGLEREGGITIQGLRDRRSNMRAQLSEANLDATAREATVLRVLDSVSQDIDQALTVNPAARKLYREADQIWRERSEFRKQVSERLLGPRNQPKSAEGTADAVMALARNDYGRTKRLWDALSAEEQNDLAASVAANLGRSPDGSFSFARLISDTQGDKLTGKQPILSEKAQRLVFGEDGMKALRDLQIISKAKVAASSERNNSGTSTSVNKLRGGLRTALWTGLGVAEGGATGGLASGLASGLWQKLGEQRTARLLMNPDFTKWLKYLPESQSQAAINKQFERLDAIAARSPQLLADTRALQETFLQLAAPARSEQNQPAPIR